MSLKLFYLFYCCCCVFLKICQSVVMESSYSNSNFAQQTDLIPHGTCEKKYICNGSTSQYVKLNVGGFLFQTTISTLTKYDCMLKAMFSGRMEVLCDSECVLIDRCGKHFGTILNFMREGMVPLPECKTEVNEILTEARYYLLQELIDHCDSWLKYLDRKNVEPIGVRVPVVISKKHVEMILKSCPGKPAIELLINRQNNKYSYTVQSDENFLRNQELFDKLLLRFNDHALFIKNLGIGSPEMCQWTFYGRNNRRVICCNSIVYATDKKQTKVDFPEARIFEEALNTLLATHYLPANQILCSNCQMSLPPTSSYDSEEPNNPLAQLFTGILSPRIDVNSMWADANAYSDSFGSMQLHNSQRKPEKDDS